MHAYVQELSDVMQRAQGAVPTKSTGRDNTGTVDVTLDHEGMLVDIVVSERWVQRLDASGLGTAVVEAFRAADSQRHATTMMALADPAALESLRRVDPNLVVPHPIEQTPMSARPVSGERLSEDAVSELEKPIPQGTPESTGQAVGGTEVQVQVTIDARGIADCQVRVAWGQPVGGSTIARAIQQAYEAARSGDLSNSPSIGSLIEQTLGELSAIQTETSGGFQ
jgi:DNA-binding protein YbaB